MLTPDEIDALQVGDVVVLADAESVRCSRGAARVMAEKAGETHTIYRINHQGHGNVQFWINPEDAPLRYSTGSYDLYYTEGAIERIGAYEVAGEEELLAFLEA